MSIRVLIADDHAIIRAGLQMMLESQSDMKVVGEATNGRDAVNLVRELQPHIAILDITMPELNGLEAAKQILESCEDTQVITLSMHDSSIHVFEALHAGVKGYLVKATAGICVVDAVRAVHAGRRYLSPEIMDLVIEHSLDPQREPVPDPLAALSSREREVLQLVAEGKKSTEIATMLHLSPKTVETYRGQLMKKLQLKNVSELIRFAIKYGLTPLE